MEVVELFPAEVRLPDGRYFPKAKIYASELGVVVLEQVGQDINIVYRGRHSEFPTLPEPRAQQREKYLVARTIDGEITARGALGCACTTRQLQNTTWDDVVQMSTEHEPL